jgi:hypothetical protein
MMKTFESGAKSSAERPRYDLCELIAFEAWAKRMAKGAVTHGERNYQKGARDPVFIRDRVNHMLEHAMRYAQGDRTDDHLGAVMANASMLLWADEQKAKSYDEARENPVPCRCGKPVTRPEQCDGPPCPFEKELAANLSCEDDGA